MATRFDGSQWLLYAMPADMGRPAQRSIGRLIGGRRHQTMTNPDPTSAPSPDQSAADGAWDPSLDESSDETRKSYSWGRNLPALRLNGPRDAERAQRPVSTPPVYRLKPPWYLRPVRIVLGMGMLAVAWGLAMLLVAWSENILATAPQTWVAEWGDFYFTLHVAGALLLAMVTLTIFAVGVFSLFVGLTARGW